MKIVTKIKNILLNNKVGRIGHKTTVQFPVDISNPKNLILGSHTSIGPRCSFLNQVAKVIINDYVMIGPEVMFITGNHRFDIIGKYMAEIKNKDKRLLRK